MSRAELKRVLVIDDEPDILAVVAITLRARGGIEVETCTSGKDALDAARGFAPDLILLDVMMPGMDGPNTLEALRADTATAAIPVVFMTAKTLPQETERYRGLGAAAVLPKPFDQSTLVGDLQAIAAAAASRSAGSKGTAGPAESDRGTDAGMDELLAAYTRALPAKLAEIRTSWARAESEPPDPGAVQVLHRLVHRLAGTAATYGHPAIGTVARALEEALEDDAGAAVALTGEQRARARSLLSALDDAVRRIPAEPE